MAKSEPAIPTPFEKFEDAAWRLFQVPKKDVDKSELRAKKSERRERPIRASIE